MARVEELEKLDFVMNNIEEIQFIMNNKETEEMVFDVDNEELAKVLNEMVFIMDNRDLLLLDEMDCNMNNEKPTEMDPTTCFPETTTEGNVNNEELLVLDEMDCNVNNEELLVLDEMDCNVNNEKPTEMDPTTCFPETTTDSLEETETHAEETSFARRKKELTNEQRLTIFHYLLKQSNKGRIQRGSVPMAAQLFSVSQRTVKRIWKQGKECQAKNLPVDVSSRKRTRVGRKAKEVDLSKIPELDLKQRTSIRSLASALHMSTTSVHRQIKKGAIIRHTNAIKPAFTTGWATKHPNASFTITERPFVFPINLVFRVVCFSTRPWLLKELPIFIS